MIDQLCLAKFLQFTVSHVKAQAPDTVEQYWFWLSGEVIRYLIQVYPEDVRKQEIKQEVSQ